MSFFGKVSTVGRQGEQLTYGLPFRSSVVSLCGTWKSHLDATGYWVAKNQYAVKSNVFPDLLVPSPTTTGVRIRANGLRPLLLLRSAGGSEISETNSGRWMDGWMVSAFGQTYSCSFMMMMPSHQHA